MCAVFSPINKYTTWRKLWLALAKGEKALGFPITESQIAAMEAEIDTIDFSRVAELESQLHHDVMAHLYAFAEKCPEAKGILHLGATSAYVTDNTDILQMQQALKLLQKKILQLLSLLKDLAEKHASQPTLGHTHFQPAQPTTVGKRICLWIQDFLYDAQDLMQREKELRFLGLKGATGTQASFMILFNHDSNKVEKLDRFVASEMGFSSLFTISGQTYTRKQDIRTLAPLESLAASSHKCATDLRLLAHLGEVGEKKGSKQIGSSAMPHKQNPILSERICGIARLLLSLCENPSYTLATQWLERSLDDSSNRRIVIPEAFLCADALLDLLISIFSKVEVHTEKMQANLDEKLPFLAMENLLMHGVKKGADRQDLHEQLRLSDIESAAKNAGLSDDEI